MGQKKTISRSADAKKSDQREEGNGARKTFSPSRWRASALSSPPPPPPQWDTRKIPLSFLPSLPFSEIAPPPPSVHFPPLPPPPPPPPNLPFTSPSSVNSFRRRPRWKRRREILRWKEEENGWSHLISHKCDLGRKSGSFLLLLRPLLTPPPLPTQKIHHLKSWSTRLFGFF